MSKMARGTSNRAKGNIDADVPRLAWSVREFAAAMGINYQTALGMIHDGTLGYFKAGAEYRIPNSEVERLLQEASNRGTSDYHKSKTRDSQTPTQN